MYDSLRPLDYSLLVYSIYGTFQARIWEQVAISYSRDLPDSRIEMASLGFSVLAGRFFYH